MSTVSQAYKLPKLRVYYAHSKAIYHKPQEKRDIILLNDLGFDVINPSDENHERLCKAWPDGAMAYFEHVVKDCQLLAFRAHADGNIGAGVVCEIDWAIEAGMPIIELPSRMLQRRLSLAQTREYLAEVGER